MNSKVGNINHEIHRTNSLRMDGVQILLKKDIIKYLRSNKMKGVKLDVRSTTKDVPHSTPSSNF